MGVWRLIAHHDAALAALEEMKERNRIAIGWSSTGDLRKAKVSSSDEVTSLIAESYDEISNGHLGGPSLWNLYRKIRTGDLVIVNANGRRNCVFEILGDYLFESRPRLIMGYAHQRPAALTELDPDRLWASVGAKVAAGQNLRWTLAACTESPATAREVLREGGRYAVISTAIERNPWARQRCIQHFGCKCFVCEFDFEKIWGDLGRGYIHVHHKIALSQMTAEHEVDPIEDLVPLCPNCHAMAHQGSGISIEKLLALYEKYSGRRVVG